LNKDPLSVDDNNCSLKTLISKFLCHPASTSNNKPMMARPSKGYKLK
jgi:hypothetical protein